MNLQTVSQLSRSRTYWAAMVVIAIVLEIIALYYQYGLDQYPCVLCIHIRIWVAAFAVIGVLGLLGSERPPVRLAANLLSIAGAVGLLERSWRLLALERGWILELSCNFDAGLPAWFALDEWLPSMFAVQATCGLSPQILFGITMAESLAALSTLTLVGTLAVTVLSLRR